MNWYDNKYNGDYVGWEWPLGIVPVDIQKYSKLTTYINANGGIGAVTATAGTPSTPKPTSTPKPVSTSAADAVSNVSPGAYASQEPEALEITKVRVMSETGSVKGKTAEKITGLVKGEGLQMVVQHGGNAYIPVTVGDVTWQDERGCCTSSMKFSVLWDEIVEISEGDGVAVKYNGEPVFFGYVFARSVKADDGVIQITAYDQLRYFKNKDTFVAEGTYTELLKGVIKKYGLKAGEIAETEYKIPKRVVEGSLFEIMADAGGRTVLSNGQHFILYDDYGKICLKNINDMKVGVSITAKTSGGYTIKTDIDSETYTRVALTYDNTQTGEREVYIANGDNQNVWGVLTKFEQIQTDGQSAPSASLMKSRAKALLKYHNVKKKTLKVEDCPGVVGVRGGSSVYVTLGTPLGDEAFRFMIVDRVTHTFSNGGHLMSMELISG